MCPWPAVFSGNAPASSRVDARPFQGLFTAIPRAFPGSFSGGGRRQALACHPCAGRGPLSGFPPPIKAFEGKRQGGRDRIVPASLKPLPPPQPLPLKGGGVSGPCLRLPVRCTQTGGNDRLRSGAGLPSQDRHSEKFVRHLGSAFQSSRAPPKTSCVQSFRLLPIRKSLSSNSCIGHIFA